VCTPEALELENRCGTFVTYVTMLTLILSERRGEEGFQQDKLKESDHWENLAIDGRIELKCILDK
jgi:hypothetical protein